jgi:hypothetical protein
MFAIGGGTLPIHPGRGELEELVKSSSGHSTRCLVMAFDGGDGIASHDSDVRIIFDRGGMSRAQRNRDVRPRRWFRDGSTHPGDRSQLMAKQ